MKFVADPSGAPMRILVISNCPLDPNQGSGYVVSGFAHRMRERGHEVAAFGIEHFTPWPQMRRLTRLRRLIGYACATWTQVRTKSFDIVELWGAEGWLALLLLRLRGGAVPIAVSRSNGLETHWSERDGLDGKGPPRGWKRRLGRLPEIAFRGCAALTVVSRYDARYARDHAYQPDPRLLVIENALEARWLGQKPNFERQPVIGFVGSWLPRKGSSLLPAAMRTVLREHPQARFLLVGIGREAQAEVAATFPGETRIETVAFCPRDEIAAHYRRMAVLLMPSSHESFGLVAAEAMSCGAALAATRTGLAADLSDAEFAAIDERSAGGIARTLLVLLQDEARRQDLARAGHARVQTLDWTAATDRLETLYRALLARH
jgi:glycosyltransferase involved in cell wall biosynthesis